jgi:hypothetical protein
MRDRYMNDAADDELRMTRIQLSRALRAERDCPGAHPMLVFADIIDSLIARIEALELARMYLRRAAQLAQCAA